MPDDYTVLAVKENNLKPKLDPRRLRLYIRHLSSAANKSEERSLKKQQVREKLDRIKSVSLNKRSTKKMLESEFGDFESVVHEIIHDEEKILEQQKYETKQVNELKKMVENLSSKLIELGKEYARELEEKDNKILDLRESLAAANIRLSESGEARKKKIEDIENKLKQKKQVNKDDKSLIIIQLEDTLSELESRHRELERSGRHKKADIERLNKIITAHKDKIKKLKLKK